MQYYWDCKILGVLGILFPLSIGRLRAKAAHSKNSRRLFFKDLRYQTEWVWPIRNDPPAAAVVGVAVVC